MYRRIVVPLDGSALAESVLPHVQTLAGTTDSAHILLIRVVEPTQTVIDDFALMPMKISDVDRENQVEAEKYLAHIVTTTSFPHAEVETKTVVGPAAKTIAELAKQFEADLIVIATHGRSGIRRLVWGSTAEHILRAATMPVLMVRTPGSAGEIAKEHHAA